MTRLEQLLAAARRHNPTDDFLRDVYGLPSDEAFDAIVVAPSWTPDKILKNHDCAIDHVSRHIYFNSYRVDFDGCHIGWIQTASGACNILDAMLSMAESACDRIIFLGAVGALSPEIELGDLATPSESISWEAATLYLQEKLASQNLGKAIVPHCKDWITAILEKAAGRGILISRLPTFCTDSIMCEYAHLDEIKATGAKLIEMETAAFYSALSLIGKKGMALLCVSDNSANGKPLIARTLQQRERYQQSREIHAPEIIRLICQND